MRYVVRHSCTAAVEMICSLKVFGNRRSWVFDLGTINFLQQSEHGNRLCAVHTNAVFGRESTFRGGR